MKLSLKIVIVLLFLAVVVAVGQLALVKIEQDSQRHINNSLRSVLNVTVESLKIWQNSRKRDIQKIASSPDVIELTSKLLQLSYEDLDGIVGSETLDLMRDEMLGSMNLATDRGFFVIRPDRISVGSMRDSNIGTENLINIQRKPLLDRAFGGETLFIPTLVSDVPLKSPSGKLIDSLPTIFVASPVLNEIGELIAVLTIRIDAYADFARITQLGRVGNTGETYAFDNNARLLTESRFDQQLQALGLVPAGEVGMLNIRITDPGGNMLQGYRPALAPEQLPLTLMAQRALAKDEAPYLETYRDYRGVEVFGAWVWDEILGFGLTTEIDRDEALLPYQRTRTTVIVLLAATVLLALMLSIFLLRLQKKSAEQQQQALEDLRQAKELAELANREKSRFLANMSHELRTPMHAILSFAELASKREADNKNQRFLDNIKASGKRLTKLLDGLLDLAKLEAGKMTASMVNTDLVELVRECLAELQGLAHDKSIRLELQVVSAESIELDDRLIGQVVINLLSNAIKFSPKHEVITIQLEKTSKRIVGDEVDGMMLSVTDRGIGIPPEDIELVFDSFTQSSKTRSEAGGTGLGLPICKEIVSLHRGLIWIESPPATASIGTRVSFFLPLTQRQENA